MGAVTLVALGFVQCQAGRDIIRREGKGERDREKRERERKNIVEHTAQQPCKE